jgi:polysaccharide export outer membrane protein
MKIKSLIHRIALWPIALSMVAAVFLVVFTGCNTTSQNSKPGNFSAKDVALPAPNTNDVVLKEGDVVRIIFPNGEKMDSVETIRPDGKITLPIIGDVSVSGKTPVQMQKELADKYSKEIRSSDAILFAVQSSAFQVYVMGSVMHPGKVAADHVLSVLDAIMEAGGFDPDRAKLKSVKVVRTKDGRTQTFVVNLQGVQKPGAPVEIFYLQPNDIVMVPQKLVLF